MVASLPEFKLASLLSTVDLTPLDLMAHTYISLLTCALQIHSKSGFPLSPRYYMSLCVWNQSQWGNYQLQSFLFPKSTCGFLQPLLLINYQVTSSPEHHWSIPTKIYRSKINLHALCPWSSSADLDHPLNTLQIHEKLSWKEKQEI